MTETHMHNDRRSGLRRVLRVVAPLALVVSVLVSIATPAFAARIVQVRVGNHPTFSRVVFELDTHTGYQIESRGDDNVLSVLIDADSRDRDVISKSLGVGSVSVESVDGKSLVSVTLRRDDLMIKEMILSNPPRIVLDFEYPKQASELASTTAGTPAPIDDTPAPVADEPVAAEPEPVQVEPEPSQPEQAATVPAEPEIEPEPEIVIADPEPEPEIAVVEPEPSVEVVDAPLGTDAGSETIADTNGATPSPDPTIGDTNPVAPDWEEPPAENDIVTQELPAAHRRPTVPVEKPRLVVREPAPTAPSQAEPESNVRMIVAIASGVLFIAGVALVRRRRGSIPADFDITDILTEPASDDAPEGSKRAEFEPTEFIRVSEGGDSADATAVITLTEESANEAVHVSEANTAAYSLSEVSANSQQAGTELFDEDPEGEKQMDMESNDLPATRGEFVVSPTGGATADSDLSSMVQELMTRLGTLETRLEESNEARERLETQVASQSEELRVQRAAIARTQRALRSLSRTDEDQATEPALRNPTT